MPLLEGERITKQFGGIVALDDVSSAIGRGLMSDHDLLLLDEASLGLAPALVDLHGTRRRPE